MKDKNRIDEHDQTKKMLDVMRYGIINESDEGSDVISPAPGDQMFKDEAKKISDSVDPRIQINKFKIYPRDRDVQFEGRLDAGINFFMSVKAMKLSISITDPNGEATKIYMDAELLATIQKLTGYYENWTREWSGRLTTDFKPKN